MRLTEKGSTSRVPRQAVLVASLLLFARATSSFVETVNVNDSGERIPWVSVERETGDKLTLNNPEKRPVLYEFYSVTDEDSKTMNQFVLHNREVADLIARNFVAVRISDENSGGGVTPIVVKSLLKRFDVGRVAALIVVTADGKELGRLDGYKPASMVYQLLAMALLHPPRLMSEDQERNR